MQRFKKFSYIFIYRNCVQVDSCEWKEIGIYDITTYVNFDVYFVKIFTHFCLS